MKKGRYTQKRGSTPTFLMREKKTIPIEIETIIYMQKKRNTMEL